MGLKFDFLKHPNYLSWWRWCSSTPTSGLAILQVFYVLPSFKLKPQWPRKWMCPHQDVCLGLMMCVSICHCYNVLIQASEPYLCILHWGLWLCSVLEELKGNVSESICVCFFIWAFEWIWIFACEQHLFNFQSNWGHAILKLNVKNGEIGSCLGTSIVPVVDSQCNDNWVF